MQMRVDKFPKVEICFGLGKKSEVVCFPGLRKMIKIQTFEKIGF